MQHRPSDFCTTRLRWSGETHAGKVRKNNEDSFLAMQFDGEELRLLGKLGEDSLDKADFAFAVSDGMGGAMAGEYASRITVDKVALLLPRAFRQSARGLDAGFKDVFEELFDQVHRALSFVGRSYEECAGMGATLSLCWFTHGWMYFGHVGDGRIYYLPAGGPGLRQVSQDDTHVGWLFRNGKLNERQARSHPRRTVLQKALGAGHQFVDPQVGAVSYEPGDAFLLCTDGLIDELYDSQLEDRLRTSHTSELELPPARRLIEAALQGPSRDNVTALVIEAL